MCDWLNLDRFETKCYSSDRIQPITDIEIVCRVGFEVRGIRGKDAKIGSGQNLIQMIVLDLLSMLLPYSRRRIVLMRFYRTSDRVCDP